MEQIRYKTGLERLLDNPNVRLECFDNEPDWLRRRDQLICTASEAAYLMDCSNFRGLLRHFYIKLGTVEEIPSKYEDERDMGHETEALHCRLFIKDTGRALEDPGDYAIVTNTKYPGMGATLDRLQYCPERGLGVLEMKWLREFMRQYWSDGCIPDSVHWQLQVQMLLTGCTWGTASACIGGCKPLWRDVKADKRMQAEIVRRVAWFARCLRDKTPPEPTGHDTDMPTLNEVFSEHTGEVIDVGASLRDTYEEMEAISSAMKPMDKRYEQLKAIVRAKMGSASKAIGMGYEFSLSTNNRLNRKARTG